MPPGDRLPRLAAQTPPGILPLVRSAVLAVLALLVGASGDDSHCGLRGHARGPRAFLPAAARENSCGSAGSRSEVFRDRGCTKSRAVSALGFDAAPAQEP